MTGDFFNDIASIGWFLFAIFSFIGIVYAGPFLILKMFVLFGKYSKNLSFKPEDNFFKRTVIKFAKWLGRTGGLGVLYWTVACLACLFGWIWLMDTLEML